MARTELRLPEDLHQRVKAAAAADRRSMNNMLVILIERGLAAAQHAEDNAA